MDKRHVRLLVLAFLLVTLLPARAWGLGVFIGPRVGTLGVGLEAGYELNDFIKLRGNVNGINWNLDNTKVSGIKYDFDMNLLTAGMLLDIHPLGISPIGGSFRISAGAYYNGNSFDLTSRPTQSVRIGDNNYTPGEVGRLDAEVDFNKFAPYLGLGWGTSPSLLPIHFTLDLGILYQGSPQVSLSSPAAGSTPGLAEDIKREERNMEDDLSSWTWYPVAMLGVVISF